MSADQLRGSTGKAHQHPADRAAGALTGTSDDLVRPAIDAGRRTLARPAAAAWQCAQPLGSEPVRSRRRGRRREQAGIGSSSATAGADAFAWLASSASLMRLASSLRWRPHRGIRSRPRAAGPPRSRLGAFCSSRRRSTRSPASQVVGHDAVRRCARCCADSAQKLATCTSSSSAEEQGDDARAIEPRAPASRAAANRHPRRGGPLSALTASTGAALRTPTERPPAARWCQVGMPDPQR